MSWLLKLAVSNPWVLLAIVLAIFSFGAMTGGSAAWWIQGLKVTAAQLETKSVQQAFDEFTLDTKDAGLKAEAKRIEDEQKAKDNLKKVQADHEKQIPTIRARAAANYRAAHRMPDDAGASAGSGSVRQDGAGIRMDAGTSKECLDDQGFIEDAAEDALKVEAWRAWCALNECLVDKGAL